MIRQTALRVEVPRKLAPLLKLARYKGAHGGRGGAKSHFFAEQIVLQCYAAAKRVVCIREIQESIKDSVKTLLEQKIQKLGLGTFFEILQTEIRGKNGSLIIFRGMQTYNAQNIKSLEDFDIAWVEEGQTLSATSWRMLRPTIRKPGSEIWCSWNPRHDTDAIDEFFRGPNRHKDAVCVEINWPDNPWFPSVLKDEMERDYHADPEMAEHVWGGGYEIVSEGAYYARLLAKAEKEGRFGDYAYREGQQTISAWDLGIRDHNPIWFIVEDMEYATVVDFYEVSGEGFDHIVATCMPELFIPPKLNETYLHWNREQALKDFNRPIPFKYKRHMLPHDVGVKEQSNSGRERYKTLSELGLGRIGHEILRGTAANPEDRVNAVRQILPRIRFNTDNPRVMRGVKRLRQYKRKFNEATGEYEGPLHDEASHAADAFGEYAINCPWYKPKPKEDQQKVNVGKLEFRANADGSYNISHTVAQMVEARKRAREGSKF